ncbi:MAG: hypothetical protein ACE5DY_02495 [Mariprofundaceae bacterium]
MSNRIDKFRERYDAIVIEEMPGETTWVDRLLTWEMFKERGEQVAALLKNTAAHSSPGNLQDIIEHNPKLYDLLMDAYA